MLMLINSMGNFMLMSQKVGACLVSCLNRTSSKSNLAAPKYRKSRPQRWLQSSSKVYLWQSFNYSSDMFLPEVKIGQNLRMCLELSFILWRSADDPWLHMGNGELIFPRIVCKKEFNEVHQVWAVEWPLLQQGPAAGPNDLFFFSLVSNQDEVYFIYHANNNSSLMRIALNQANYIWEMSSWSALTQSWMVFLRVPKDYCWQWWTLWNLLEVPNKRDSLLPGLGRFLAKIPRQVVRQ